MTTEQPTRYCDLVMKGGITSGIVYPNAVLALAREFRFKNIGGTSAGAIAAAATAAAALGDRKQSQSGYAASVGEGYSGLKKVADDLKTKGFIFGLFKPAQGARSAYRLIVTLAGKSGKARKWFTGIVAVTMIAPLEMLTLLLILLGLGYFAAGAEGVVAAALPALFCAYFGAAICALLKVASVVRANNIGVCSGLGRPGIMSSKWVPARFRRVAKPGLTEWLHLVLQQLAGLPANEPLLFAHLWNAPRYEGEPDTDRSLTLQMITTSISHHEPRTLPFVEAGFWFLREEFDRLFPAVLVDAMVKEAGDPIKRADRAGIERSYYRLPTLERMPVLVATRMSLSFPLLISAVPLHEPTTRERKPAEIDEGQGDVPENAGPPERTLSQSTEGLTTGGVETPSKIEGFRRCWFSDGGIASNFPLHLFDSPLPLWPTFAINLLYPKTDDSGLAAAAPANKTPTKEDAEAAVWLPLHNNIGWQRTYQEIDDPDAFKEVGGFVSGILGTMQGWRDLLQSRAPGQRDRIVHISLNGAEGGMNLNMPQEVLDSISMKGTAAGERFEKFSFANHHWIRWRNVAAAFQRYVMALAAGAAVQPQTTEKQEAFATAATGKPDPASYDFRSTQREKAAQDMLAALITWGDEWNDELRPDLTKGAPRPSPQMQISPLY